MMKVVSRALCALLLCLLAIRSSHAQNPGQSAAFKQNDPYVAGFLKQYCQDCHATGDKSTPLNLMPLLDAPLADQSANWEKVVRKLRTRQMPPLGEERPGEAEYRSVVSTLESLLDHSARLHPHAGRTETFRRLTRTEYHNAIRDLLKLDVDVTELLPPDQISHGFDNITVNDLSPTLLDRYVTAAQKISRLAIGNVRSTPDGATFRIAADVTQDAHVPGLPLGTRGGGLFQHQFPQTGEYEIQIRLSRDRNEEIEGLNDSHELEILIDGERKHTFTVAPPPGKNYDLIDRQLIVRIPVVAGPHDLGVTFVKNPTLVQEIKRQPLEVHFNMHRHPRQGPAVYQVTVTGPFNPQGPSSTPSRSSILKVSPDYYLFDSKVHAETALRQLARLAYRRPVTDEDLVPLMRFYEEGHKDGTFETGMEAALNALLVSPQFLFRIERQPEGIAPGTAYAISDVELASRLSFFLWSSIPDEHLLRAAEQNTLHNDLQWHVQGMLRDPRAQNLVSNFADQWLYLRNLDSFTPEQRLFPDFDDNLRQAMRQETEHLFAHVMRSDLSVLELIRADYTFLNERLAKHYEIPHVYGSHFRRVDLPADSHRGGLLRLGSILTVTSYATRTSPVIRGKWILENLLGAPPPPPPANVPALKDVTLAGNLTVRQRLAEHRANPACAGCHNMMDPIGFSLENFDAIGRWRDREDDTPVDVTGAGVDGLPFQGVDGLERALLERPELFVSTLTEKLMTFALGRGIEPADAPAIREILRIAHTQDDRFSFLVSGIVLSTPFRMRTAQ